MNTTEALIHVKGWLDESCDTLGNGQTVRAVSSEDDEAIWSLVRVAEATLPKPQSLRFCCPCGADYKSFHELYAHRAWGACAACAKVKP